MAMTVAFVMAVAVASAMAVATAMTMAVAVAYNSSDGGDAATYAGEPCHGP